MNCSKLLLIPLTFTSLYMIPNNAQIMQKTAIIQKAVAIEKQMTRERYIVYGLTALSIAQSIHPWFVLYKGKPESVEPKKLSFTESIKEGFNNLFYTQEGWVSIADAVIGVGSGIVISQVCDRLIHPDTSRWYVHTYASYGLTIDMMQGRLLVMRYESKDSTLHGDHKQYLQLLYELLVNQSELICAYMVYKTKHLGNEEKALAQRAVRSMFVTQKSWLQLISTQLSADSIDYQGLDNILVEYQANIGSQLNHFSVIEGETLQERYVVKRQIKQSLA